MLIIEDAIKTVKKATEITKFTYIDEDNNDINLGHDNLLEIIDNLISCYNNLQDEYKKLEEDIEYNYIKKPIEIE